MDGGGYSRSGCVRCETCVGSPPSRKYSRGLPPNPEEHAQLGHCTGPLSADHRLTRVDETGEVYLPGSAVMPGRGYQHLRFYTCPLAVIGERACPVPGAAWIDRATEAAAWVADGGALADVEPAPLPALVTAARVVLSETRRIHREKRAAEQRADEARRAGQRQRRAR